MLKPYFVTAPGDPAPLRADVPRRVRFEEVDALGIVWHGRYPGYFEDARVALGERFGIGYLELYQQGIVAPIRSMRIDYHRPLFFGEVVNIEAILHWSEALRFNHEFIIRRADGQVATTGATVQMFLDRDEQLLLLPPPMIAVFRRRWREGVLA